MITFSNVSLIYPNSTKTILEDLSFEIVEGEFVLVIGSTGSGKSSLLRLINGLVPHHTGGILAGDIHVDGLSTQLVKPGGLAHLIGIVGQNPANGFVADTVEEELVFGMEALNTAPEVMRKRVEEILDLLSLTPLRNRQISTLSGGEQQRLAIGTALVMHPKVLVLDEPTSALDPIAAEEVLSILHRLVHDLSLTVVIAEHRLERVIGFVDRILEISGQGVARIEVPEIILKDSKIAPPIVHLARGLALPEVGLSVREVRRMTEELRGSDGSEGIGRTERRVIAASTPLFGVSDLHISYGDFPALKGVSVNVYPGQVLCVMGRNGAGKSSLLRALFEKAKCGYVPQEPGDLLYHQSVAAECAQSDRDNKLAKGTTYSLLSKLLSSISPDVHPRDLSEGQRLALALSIVLASNPEALILDEPTRGLDYQAKAVLINILKSYSQELEKPIILATHDVELVAEVADRVLFLADGEVVADGPVLDVLLSSPAFAPQIAKVMSPKPWLTVSDVMNAVSSQ